MDGIIAKLNHSPFNLWIPRKDPWGTRDPSVKTTVLERRSFWDMNKKDMKHKPVEVVKVKPLTQI